MEREERKQHFSTDQKLETISFLRRSAAENKQRLYQADAILNGQPADRIDFTKQTDSAASVREEEPYAPKLLSGSFFFRCLIALACLFVFLILGQTTEPQTRQYIDTIKGQIETDYSENMFDFIRQIPYTLPYEKTNVKG